MKCKRHTIDFSSSIGVCASCLRERLFSIAASTAASESEDSNHLPPLFFPRSVSPYVAPRKSDAVVLDSSKTRFFATPQVGGPTTTDQQPSESERSFKKKKKRNGLSRFSTLFRTRSDDYDSRTRTDDSLSHDGATSTFSQSSSSSSTSRSWLSKVLSVKSKKNTTCYIEDLIESDHNRPRQQRYCRGMSPADKDYDFEEQRRTPAMGTPVRKKTVAATATTTAISFCLSPLVRAKPNCVTKWKGKFPPEFGYSGEIKSPAKPVASPHISTAASFCANRSKKLVDLGRVDLRR
ncbi:hypothetical protein AALP_AA4G235000 [Arabis alpina]|uniref:Uncharacterized protein n=1 Tax=Arabis alpina TaxID=50452 RepID=A0A087H563_ARAAL|nr:hypothetical protein AALP_AA4G235000 [Arabis alpina]